jgi:hypothetical protein
MRWSERVMLMNLKELLLEKKANIIETWCDITRRTYPLESQKFFSKKDKFGNPVGFTISTGLPVLFEALVEGKQPEMVSEVLDSMIRIRAIQEFSPSEAVSFILGLKSVVREELGDKVLQNGVSEEWVALEGKIDSVALLGFDIYAHCRQEIFDIRVREVKKQSERLLKMTGFVYEIPEWEGDKKKSDEEPTAVNKGDVH